jgi:hypothetical protein
MIESPPLRPERAGAIRCHYVREHRHDLYSDEQKTWLAPRAVQLNGLVEAMIQRTHEDGKPGRERAGTARAGREA